MSIETAKKVLKTEAEAIMSIIDRIGPEFEKAERIIADTKGRIIITGLGKSGIIGRKIASTLSSVGIPAFFLHPVEGAGAILVVEPGIGVEVGPAGIVQHHRRQHLGPRSRPGDAPVAPVGGRLPGQPGMGDLRDRERLVIVEGIQKHGPSVAAPPTLPTFTGSKVPIPPPPKVRKFPPAVPCPSLASPIG